MWKLLFQNMKNNMSSKLTKKEILQILNATDIELIDYMSQTMKYRENNLITFSKNIFIPLTEICRNDCGYCNFKKDPTDSTAIILKSKEEILLDLKEAEKYGCKEVERFRIAFEGKTR